MPPQFQLFDTNKDGYLDYHELKVALKALGFDLPKNHIVAILCNHGTSAADSFQHGKQVGPGPSRPTFSGPHRVLLAEPKFMRIAAEKVLERDPRDEINRAFDLLDRDRKGLITFEDLHRVARELGEGMQDDELLAMIEEFDVRGEGGANRDEFLGICLAA